MNNPNVTLHFNVEKLSLKDLSSGQDTLSVDGLGDIKAERTHVSYNYTPALETAPNYRNIKLSREVLSAEIRKQKLDLMPEFKFTWHYTGMEVVEPWAIFYDYNKAFVRKRFH